MCKKITDHKIKVNIMKINRIVYGSISTIISLISITVSAPCAPHASTVGSAIWRQADNILSAHGANKVIFQSDIPYTIPNSGIYALGESITSTSPSIITNNFTNVTIDLKQHTINGASGAAAGITMGANSSAKILNGTMMQFASTATAIKLNSSGSMIIEDMRFINNRTSISATGLTRGLAVEDCYFLSSTSTASSVDVALRITNSIDISINNCQSIGGGFVYATNSSGISIENVEKSLGASLANFSSVNNSYVNDCNHIGVTNAIVLANSSYNIVSNCTWVNTDTTTILISGSSTGNEFNNICIHAPYQSMAYNSISIGSGVTVTRILSSIVHLTSPSALFNNAGTNTQVYNSYLRNVNSTIITGNPFTTIGGNNNTVANNTTNYWRNLQLVN